MEQEEKRKYKFDWPKEEREGRKLVRVGWQKIVPFLAEGRQVLAHIALT